MTKRSTSSTTPPSPKKLSGSTTSWATPQPTDVLSYTYLWADDAARGHEEGSKERPVVVVLAIERRDDLIEVMVAPFTTKPPRTDNDHVRVPTAVSAHLGLGEQTSWIAVSEVNRFRWPGPDLRPAHTGAELTPYYGMIPGQLLRIVRERLAAHIDAAQLRMTDRSS